MRWTFVERETKGCGEIVMDYVLSSIELSEIQIKWINHFNSHLITIKAIIYTRFVRIYAIRKIYLIY